MTSEGTARDQTVLPKLTPAPPRPDEVASHHGEAMTARRGTGRTMVITQMCGQTERISAPMSLT